jgi:hypothetical protein
MFVCPTYHLLSSLKRGIICCRTLIFHQLINLGLLLRDLFSGFMRGLLLGLPDTGPVLFTPFVVRVVVGEVRELFGEELSIGGGVCFFRQLVLVAVGKGDTQVANVYRWFAYLDVAKIALPDTVEATQ